MITNNNTMPTHTMEMVHDPKDYRQRKLTVNLNRVTYLVTRKLAETLVDLGAIIFGGYIRDKIIHDHYCNLFIDRNNGHGYLNYDETNVDVKTLPRLLVADDIDLFIRGDKDDVDVLYNKLRDLDYDVISQEVNPIYGFHDDEISHQKVVVKSSKGSSHVTIKLDVLYGKTPLDPPFGVCDFTCNSLVFDKYGIRLSRNSDIFTEVCPFVRKERELATIQAMKEFKTELLYQQKPTNDPKYRRILASRLFKMQEKGFQITNIKSYTVENYDPNCRCSCVYYSDCECCGGRNKDCNQSKATVKVEDKDVHKSCGCCGDRNKNCNQSKAKLTNSLHEYCVICKETLTEGKKVVRLKCCGVLADFQCFTDLVRSTYLEKNSISCPNCSDTMKILLSDDTKQ